jgi:lipopolysaccharide export system protein LptA
VIATGDVYCRLKDSSGKMQSIECAKLDMQTARSADGKVYPHLVDAFGDASAVVHAYVGTQDLRAGVVQMTLRPSSKAVAAPSTRPADGGQIDTAAVELEKMTALQRVKVTGHDGGKASADELRVVMEKDEPHITLSGQSLARVEDAKHNKVTGPIITFDPKRGEAHVNGPGTMNMIHSDEPPVNAGAKRLAAANPNRDRSVNVIWSDHADIDGMANRIDVWGKVECTSPDADGTVNTSDSEHVRIDLQKKPPLPATRPAANPVIAVATTTKPATRPDGVAGSMQMDLFKDKEPALITLDKNAVVTSTLADASGKILRQFELKGPTIQYALQTTPALPAHSLLVPAAGQMLVRDHRPPAPNDKSKSSDDTAAIGGRGATAFKWNKQLLYNEDARRADLTGDVLIVHQGDDAKEEPARLTADQVTAWFKQPEKAGNAAQSAGAAPAAMELKWLTASGRPFVTRGTAELTAQKIDLDPVNHRLAAYGTDREPTVFTNTATNDTTTANEVNWNTQTWDVKFKWVSSRSRR